MSGDKSASIGSLVNSATAKAKAFAKKLVSGLDTRKKPVLAEMEILKDLKASSCYKLVMSGQYRITATQVNPLKGQEDLVDPVQRGFVALGIFDGVDAKKDPDYWKKPDQKGGVARGEYGPRTVISGSCENIRRQGRRSLREKQHGSA
jgi:hypothetical protein